MLSLLPQHPLKLNLRSAPCVNIHRFLLPAPPCVFTPCSRSFSCPVPRSSTPRVKCSLTPMVGASTLQALLNFVVVAVLMPLDPSVPPYRPRLWLPPCPSGLHMIRLIQITLNTGTFETCNMSQFESTT